MRSQNPFLNDDHVIVRNETGLLTIVGNDLPATIRKQPPDFRVIGNRSAAITVKASKVFCSPLVMRRKSVGRVDFTPVQQSVQRLIRLEPAERDARRRIFVHTEQYS